MVFSVLLMRFTFPEDTMAKIQITFYGGVGSVTGANFLLTGEKTKLLVDCGLEQGTPEAAENAKEPFAYDPKSVNYLFITHAHMDHIGRVPKLVRDGFQGTIYSTQETKDLSSIMFQDAIRLQDFPLYDINDVNKSLSFWKTLPYDVESKINEEFSVALKDAGHILGSTMYRFTFGDKRIYFTGDSGNSPSPLLKNTEPITDATYLVMDSVYGDRNHEPKEERDERFIEIVLSAIQNQGTLVIPAFSIERTQVILYELNNLIEKKIIPQVPVFLDSPLAQKVTAVYMRDTQDFNSNVQNQIKSGDDIFQFPRLHVIHSVKESNDIVKTANPKIIIAGSGMSSGGRVVTHEMNFLPDPKSTILLMGYQAIGTLGRRIQDKPSQIEINGQNISVRARIEMISGYSSHKDSDHLVEMVSDTAKTVKKVFVVMGEPKASAYLAQRLHNELEIDAICPEKGQSYNLD